MTSRSARRLQTMQSRHADRGERYSVSQWARVCMPLRAAGIWSRLASFPNRRSFLRGMTSGMLACPLTRASHASGGSVERHAGEDLVWTRSPEYLRFEVSNLKFERRALRNIFSKRPKVRLFFGRFIFIARFVSRPLQNRRSAPAAAIHPTIHRANDERPSCEAWS